MELYFVFIAIGMALFIIGLISLVWSVRSGQFDDMDTPALRMLIEENSPGTSITQPSTSAPSGKPAKHHLRSGQ